jgi:hypothetical protein
MKMEKSELDILKEQLASCRRLYRSHEGNTLWYKDDTGFHIECLANADSCGPEIIVAHEFPQIVYRNFREEIELFHKQYKLTRDELDYVFPQGKYQYWHRKEAMFYASLVGELFHHNGYVLNECSVGNTELIPRDLKLRIFAVDYYKSLRRKRK